MQIIYIDVLFLINAAANYLILMLTARMGGFRIRRGSFFVSSILGSIYGVCPFIGITFLEHPLCKIGIGILMAIAAFGREKRLIKAILLLFCSSAALGGMILGAELLLGSNLRLEDGVLYSWVDIRLLMFLLFLSYEILNAVCKRLFLHKSSEISMITVFVRGHVFKLNALIDTGNTLMDSVGNCPVLIADGDACGELFAGQIPLEKPIEALEILNASGETGYRILPYHSVGVKGGLLLAVRADKIVANGKAVRDALIAFSPTPLGDGGRYQALIGGEAWNWQ